MKNKIIIILVVIILGAAMGGLVFYFSNPEEKTNNTANNKNPKDDSEFIVLDEELDYDTITIHKIEIDVYKKEFKVYYTLKDSVGFIYTLRIYDRVNNIINSYNLDNLSSSDKYLLIQHDDDLKYATYYSVDNNYMPSIG